MGTEEILRFKHITEFSKLFKGVEYQEAWGRRAVDSAAAFVGLPAGLFCVKDSGRRQYLWRAGDQDGDVTDILAQSRCNRRAARPVPPQVTGTP